MEKNRTPSENINLANKKEKHSWWKLKNKKSAAFEVQDKNIKKQKPKSPGFLSRMQTLGKTFMLPIAMLAFCGILLGIGSSLTSENTINQMPWLGVHGLHEFFVLLSTIGNVGFSLLPFMFAMAIPLGLASDNRGVAAFSGFIGYAALLFSMNFMVNVLPQSFTGDDGYIGKAVQTVIGIKTLDVGVLGAILTGLLVYLLHERFQYVVLPSAIAFWGGRRFVPIMALLCFSGIGLVLAFVWPGFNLGIYYVGIGVQKVDWFGPFLYRFTANIIQPTGLHHIVNTVVRFTSVGGHWVDPHLPTGENVFEGALNIFYQQLKYGKEAVDYRVTRFLSQGYMPYCMFGLPAAAIAMLISAPKERRKEVRSVIIPGIVAASIGGITEPIEFLFLFISPALYAISCMYIGFGYMIMGLCQVRIGNTDGNFIDFVVFGLIQGLWTKWWVVLLVGPSFFVLYFVTFYFWIVKRNLPTPGRGDEASDVISLVSDQGVNQRKKGHKAKDLNLDQARGYLALLGGKENIKILDNCYTRLRITLKEHREIALEDVKKLGAIGLKVIDEVTIQIIIGPKVEKVKTDIDRLMREG